MHRGVTVLVCLLFLSTAGCASYSRARAAKRAKENSARVFAQEWLEMLDTHRYDEAFLRKSVHLRVSGTAEQFERGMRARRAPFGRVISRKFIGAAFMKTLVGLPDGEYEAVLFKTSFENKAVAAERVILSRERGRQQVIAYRVY